jgi:hypothetical protein
MRFSGGRTRLFLGPTKGEPPMNRSTKTTVLVLALSLVSIACHAGSMDVFQIGARAGSYTDNSDFFIGVDAKFKVLMLSANPSVEYVFVDGGDLMTFNADALLSILNLPMVSGWLGAGIGLMYFSPDRGDSSTDPLFNLIAGAGLGIPLNPYVMAKWVFADQSDGFVIGVGVRF